MISFSAKALTYLHCNRSVVRDLSFDLMPNMDIKWLARINIDMCISIMSWCFIAGNAWKGVLRG
jgi:hypothetical protein